MNLNLPANREIVFFCVGTDRSTGDSLGPLVGTALQKLGYHVIGTMDDPAHAKNVVERMREIPEGAFVVAVDACLGQMTSVGQIQIGEGEPLFPGRGVGKDLPPVGDSYIAGIVNVAGFMEYFVLQNTRLSLVMKMADQIVEMIHAAMQQRTSNLQEVV